MKKKKGLLKFYIILTPVILVMLLPLVYVIFHAFKSTNELNAYPPQFITLHPTLDNFKRLFLLDSQSVTPVSSYLVNSVLIALAVTFLAVLISLSAGYVLSKKNFRGKKGILAANQTALMFVPVAVAIPRFLIIKNLGLTDNFLSQILPLIAMPVSVFLVKQFIDGVPLSLIEAARIDGASEFLILFKIVMPIVMPALATVAILAFQSAWNSVEASQYFISDEGIKSFAYYLSSVSANTASLSAQGVSAAASLILIVPGIVLFIILQARVLNTVAHSGIK
ncbi:MAG: carbohydrate ABC transporter permease [Oscillospiraceae bacterium]|jgi:multiple sugar transport system permease protein|nr:carbohydrate ABC transporter permease [Oscillospiraceae bacterium]